METLAQIQIGNVVKEYVRGNVKIKICDDAYRSNTPEDVDRILKRITAIGYENLNKLEEYARGNKT